MTNGADQSRDAFAAAVRTFTESEVALGEFVAAAHRFRSASQSLEQAQSALELTRDPVLQAIDTLRAMAEDLQVTSASLRGAAETLAKLDPERFWTAFSSLETQSSSNHATVVAELGGLSRIAGQVRLLVSAGLLVSLAATGIAIAVLLR